MNYTKLEKIKLKIIELYGNSYKKSFIVTNHLTIMKNDLKIFTVHQNYNNLLRIYYQDTYFDLEKVSSVIDFIKNNILGE